MTVLNDIKKARELGKNLRLVRERQEINASLLAIQCGMPLSQLLALESGNLFAFSGTEAFYRGAHQYAFCLGVDLGDSIEHERTALLGETIHDPVIPRFLRKKNHPF